MKQNREWAYGIWILILALSLAAEIVYRHQQNKQQDQVILQITQEFKKRDKAMTDLLELVGDLLGREADRTRKEYAR